MPTRLLQPGLTLAVLLVITAMLLFDLQAVLIKIMGAVYPIEQIVLFRNLFGMLPALLVFYASGNRVPGLRGLALRQWKLAVFRGLTLVCAQMSFYIALQHMDLAIATTLAYAGPLFVTLLSVPILGDRIGWIRAIAVMLGFYGVVLIMAADLPGPNLTSGVQANTQLPLHIMVLPLLAAICYATSSVTSRLFDADVSTSLLNLHTSGACMLVILAFGLFNGTAGLPETPKDLGLFILMGSCGGFAVLLLITAYRMSEPGNLSPFEYFGIPFSFILGWLFFDEAPFERLFPGAIFIVLGGLLIFWRKRRLKPATTTTV